MSKNKDYYNDFLLKDFEQQYQEYRRAETSRIHYIQFFSSLVIAVIAFFAALYQVVGFPAPNIYPVVILLFLSIILFCIGYGVANICVSTRVSQMQTAKYLNEVATYFLKSKKENKLKASRKGIYFAEKDWTSERMPFLQLMNIIAFLLGVLNLLTLFSVSRLIFFGLESGGIIPVFDFLEWFSFWDFMTWSNVISAIVGTISFFITHKMIKRKIRRDLRESQGK